MTWETHTHTNIFFVVQSWESWRAVVLGFPFVFLLTDCFCFHCWAHGQHTSPISWSQLCCWLLYRHELFIYLRYNISSFYICTSFCGIIFSSCLVTYLVFTSTPLSQFLYSLLSTFPRLPPLYPLRASLSFFLSLSSLFFILYSSLLTFPPHRLCSALLPFPSLSHSSSFLYHLLSYFYFGLSKMLSLKMVRGEKGREKREQDYREKKRGGKQRGAKWG